MDPLATPAILQPWIEDEEAIRLAKLRVEADLRKETAIQKFREQREAGATFMDSVKAAGEDAGYMTHVLKQANMFELSPERLKILHQGWEEYRDSYHA